MPGSSTPETPASRSFRKAPVRQRREMCDALAGRLDSRLPDEAAVLSLREPAVLDFADTFTENAFGIMAVPAGACPSLLVDGVSRLIPLATEEPSVVAAASHASAMVSLHGGCTTGGGEPLLAGTLYLEATPDVASSLQILESLRDSLENRLKEGLASMEARGGGFRGLSLEALSDVPGIVRLSFLADVQDAMGANLVNSCAESLRPLVEGSRAGQVVMAILSNNCPSRAVQARFRLPVHALPPGPLSRDELARKIALASRIAAADPDRAVTHNKGIMNGISALALATGNDTRAIEAAVHSWASRDGRYRAVSSFRLDGGFLEGSFEAPLPFASVGGACSAHPLARYHRALAGNPGGPELSRIAGALGLVQNLAALMALAGEGIQKGHMRLHDRRTAPGAGTEGGSS